MEIGRGRQKGNVFVMLIVERFNGLRMQKFPNLYRCPEQQSDINVTRWWMIYIEMVMYKF